MLTMLITNDFGTYRLRNPVIVDEGSMGQCLRAEYQAVDDWPGQRWWWMLGDFRTDRIIDSRIEKRAG